MKPIVRLFALAGTLALAQPAAAQPALAPTYAPTYGQDRAEIEDLMARYLFAIDYFDWDSYVATFAADGELEFASGTSKGHEAIRKAVTDFSKGIGRFYHTEDGKAATLRHVILQSSIRVEGRRAWARSQWLEMANHGPGDTMKMGTFGEYEDELRKVGGHWLFTKRRVLNEFIANRRSGPTNPVREMDKMAQAARPGG
ncbi:MAG: nuclear transport factor 2 family protein [Croceibacterium sp.]